MSSCADYDSSESLFDVCKPPPMTRSISSLRRRLQAGFTLIELMVVLVIIGVLAALIVGLVTFGLGLLNVPGIVMSIFTGMLLILVIAIPVVLGKISRRRKAA